MLRWVTAFHHHRNEPEAVRACFFICRNTGDVMRLGQTPGENWHEVSGNLPTDFRASRLTFTPHEPETVYVVPRSPAMDCTYVQDGKASASIEEPQQAEMSGRPPHQGSCRKKDCLRERPCANAMARGTIARQKCGILTTSAPAEGQGCTPSSDAGAIVGIQLWRDFAGGIVRWRVQTLTMIRVMLPTHICELLWRTLRAADVELEVAASRLRSGRCSMRSRPVIPMLAGGRSAIM